MSKTKKSSKAPVPSKPTAAQLLTVTGEAALIKDFMQHAALWFSPVGSRIPQAPEWLRAAAEARLAALKHDFVQAREQIAAPVAPASPPPALEPAPSQA